MTQTITRLQLLDSMQTGHRRFMALVAEISPEDMLRPGVIGAWSVKDTLAHILVHEQRMVDWVAKTLRGEPVNEPQPYSMPDAELNALNEQIYQQNRDRPPAEVLAGLEAAHLQALALVQSAGEADLFDPLRFHLRDGEPLWEAIAANTYWHYEEHGQPILTLSSSSKTTSSPDPRTRRAPPAPPPSTA